MKKKERRLLSLENAIMDSPKSLYISNSYFFDISFLTLLYFISFLVIYSLANDSVYHKNNPR
jgi:hypothetical protein